MAKVIKRFNPRICRGSSVQRTSSQRVRCRWGAACTSSSRASHPVPTCHYPSQRRASCWGPVAKFFFECSRRVASSDPRVLTHSVSCWGINIYDPGHFMLGIIVVWPWFLINGVSEFPWKFPLIDLCISFLTAKSPQWRSLPICLSPFAVSMDVSRVPLGRAQRVRPHRCTTTPRTAQAATLYALFLWDQGLEERLNKRAFFSQAGCFYH